MKRERIMIAHIIIYIRGTRNDNQKICQKYQAF